MSRPLPPSSDVWNELSDRAVDGLVRNHQRYQAHARKRNLKWIPLVLALLTCLAAATVRQWPQILRIGQEGWRRITLEIAPTPKLDRKGTKE